MSKQQKNAKMEALVNDLMAKHGNSSSAQEETEDMGGNVERIVSKRPVSDKQREHLAKAREIANERKTHYAQERREREAREAAEAEDARVESIATKKFEQMLRIQARQRPPVAPPPQVSLRRRALAPPLRRPLRQQVVQEEESESEEDDDMFPMDDVSYYEPAPQRAPPPQPHKRVSSRPPTPRNFQPTFDPTIFG